MHFTFLICFQFFLCNFFGLSFSYVTKVSQFRKSKKNKPASLTFTKCENIWRKCFSHVRLLLWGFLLLQICTPIWQANKRHTLSTEMHFNSTTSLCLAIAVICCVSQSLHALTAFSKCRRCNFYFGSFQTVSIIVRGGWGLGIMWINSGFVMATYHVRKTK